MSNFYSCTNEKINAYESTGGNCLDALKAMYDGLLEVQESTRKPVVVSNIIMTLTEDDKYGATAYTFGELGELS